MAQAVINQITERVVKGSAGEVDTLTFTALTIVRVGLLSSSTDFLDIVDFKLNAGNIDWSPSGSEPPTGQAYFVTYTFQAISSFKDFDTITDQMDVNLRALQPLASTQPGSVTRNLHIDLPGTQLTDLYGSIQRVSKIQSLDNLDDFEGDELDEYASNFSVFRLPSSIATGNATFTAPNAALQAILIPAGTRVSTLSTATQASIFFTTIADATIFPGETTVSVDIEADLSGSNGNVGSESIVLVTTPILGISTVTNQNPSSGGSDQESDEDYRDRIKKGFQSGDINTFRGIRRRALLISNVIDALVVGAGDALLVRGGGTGGKADVYIQAEAGLARTKIDDGVVFGGIDIPFLKQPVISISSVFNVTTATTLDPATDLLLVKDVGDLRESTISGDALRILSGAVAGNVLDITYIHNAVLDDVQLFFSDEENDIPSRDILARSATTVFIDVTATIKLDSGFDIATIEPLVIDAVATHIDNLKLGAEIKYGKIFDLIREITGVNDVRPLDILARQGFASAETILLEKNEFPETGTITINTFE